MKQTILLLAGLLLGFLVHAYFFNPEPSPAEVALGVDHEILENMGAEIERLRAREPVYIEKVKAEIETLYVEKTQWATEDSIYGIRASADTTFHGYGKLFADYWLTRNEFDFKWEPAEPKIIVRFVPMPVKFYQKPWVCFSAGAFFTGTLFYLIK